ncbi:hypothetical protein OG458_42280 (plasmid) [Streptomyces sp. NBC_01281]|uniref:hypothetical protein n=1 Tax=Streptomyces sp. NBC_01281 TaxID=2903811 RepID=UPI002E114BB3|nr:hypothetical protein OG458_41525 [Streptomyces sp. NBC_01281]WSK66585.1 hypothetical protein OG458_42280 [Streptomyces sp. NBC_01281]
MSHRPSLASSIRGAALLIAFVCLIMLIVVLTPDHDHDDSLPRCTGQRHGAAADVVPAGARPCVLDRTSTIGTPRPGTPTRHPIRTSPPTTPTGKLPGKPATPSVGKQPAAPKAPAVPQPGKPKAPAARQPAAPKAPAARQPAAPKAPAAPAPRLR